MKTQSSFYWKLCEIILAKNEMRGEAWRSGLVLLHADYCELAEGCLNRKHDHRKHSYAHIPFLLGNTNSDPFQADFSPGFLWNDLVLPDDSQKYVSSDNEQGFTLKRILVQFFLIHIH